MQTPFELLQFKTDAKALKRTSIPRHSVRIARDTMLPPVFAGGNPHNFSELGDKVGAVTVSQRFRQLLQLQLRVYQRPLGNVNAVMIQVADDRGAGPVFKFLIQFISVYSGDIAQIGQFNAGAVHSILQTDPPSMSDNPEND